MSALVQAMREYASAIRVCSDAGRGRGAAVDLLAPRDLYRWEER